MKPLLLLLLCSVPVLAQGQVVVHQAALRQLAGIMPPPPPVVEAPAPALPVHHVAIPRRAVHKAPPVVVAVAKPPAPSLAVPVVAKPVVPVIPKPAAPKPAAPPPVATLRFADGSADLPANATAALQPFCRRPAGTVSIAALAAGDPSDPSVAMRLSLRRAFAVRNALTACGIPAANIIPMALGSMAGHDPNLTQISPGR